MHYRISNGSLVCKGESGTASAGGGSDPNDSREGWGTVLQVAAFQDSELIVKKLLEAKADVNLHYKGDFRGVRIPEKLI